MESIVKEIGVLKPNLVGKLYRMGSARNGLKINHLDELDLSYEMNLQTILGNNVKFKKFEPKDGRMILKARTQTSQNTILSDFLQMTPNYWSSFH